MTPTSDIAIALQVSRAPDHDKVGSAKIWPATLKSTILASN
jgi:hypothetical protein